jgi:magnesium transporter
MIPTALDIDYEEILDNIRYLLENNQTQFVRNILADLHPADISDLIERLDSKYRSTVFSLLLPEVASEVLAELEDALKEDILEDLDTRKIAELVSEMDSDDATDLVSELPQEKVSEVLAHVEEEYSEDIQELLHYPEDTAGGIMAKEFVAVNQNCTVEEAIDELRRKREEVEEIYQCYVVDDTAKLVGFVPLKDLILAKAKSILKDVMDTDVFAIDREMDQEEVAYIFDKYDLVSAAVVNKDHQIIGRITIDDIVDVINEETDEDIARMAGIGEEEILEESVPKIVKARLPWLVVSFFGQLISAYIMSRFEASIEKILVSAFFIPLVMAMGGSVGQQTGVIVVRGLATGEINPKDIRRRLLRETKAAVVNAAVIALLTLAAVVTVIGTEYSNFGMVLACSLVVVVFNASLFGALIPFGFKKIDIDPAIASGPFVATFNDVVGLIIYFSLLAIAMHFGII